jgi:23S rRNA (guanosine2251-2'-O)-methyltransferase
MSTHPENAAAEGDLQPFEGEIAALAALQAGRRSVRRLLIDASKDRDDVAELLATARDQRVPVERVDAAAIAHWTGGNTHGGVVALAATRTYSTLAADDFSAADGAWYAMLDGIEDPFNFGQAVRALYAAGCAGLALRTRTWRGGDGLVARASAGATEWMPTAHVDSLDDAVTQFRARGYRVAMTARDSRAQSIYDTDLRGPLFLLIGGEKRGLKRALLEQADLVLRIPYKRRFPHSLGSAGSAAVLAFELMRQRFSPGATTAI